MAVSRAEAMRGIDREVRAMLHAVRRTSMDSARLIHPELQATAYAVLLFVADNEPTRAADIVERFGIDKGTISRQIAHVQELGLVTRSCDPGDRRAQTLRLTPDGKARIDTVAEQRRAEAADHLAGWTAVDLTRFAEILGRFNASFGTTR